MNETERAVLLEIVRSGGVLRSTIGARLGLSKATVSTAVQRLERARLVSAFKTTQGSLGRPAALYRSAVEAGACLGIDLGTTRVRVRAAGLDGRLLAAAEMSVRRSTVDIGPAGVDGALRLIQEIGEELRAMGSPVRRCVIAAPIRINRSAPLPGALGPVIKAVHGLFVYPGLVVSVENNVNCAAVAEGAEGAAKGVETFALLQVGVKIGLGVVYEGRLLAGGNGGAGEVASLPYPWSEGQRPRHAALEEHLGSSALMSRARKAMGLDRAELPTPEALFKRAQAGDEEARAQVEAHAREVGELASAVVAMFDPLLVLLGGGVGQNTILLEGVRRALGRLAWTTEVEAGVLGQEATVVGAVWLGLGSLLEEVLNGGHE